MGILQKNSHPFSLKIPLKTLKLADIKGFASEKMASAVAEIPFAVAEKTFSIAKRASAIAERTPAVATEVFSIATKAFAVAEEPSAVATEVFSIATEVFAVEEKAFSVAERTFSIAAKAFDTEEKNPDLAGKEKILRNANNTTLQANNIPLHNGKRSLAGASGMADRVRHDGLPTVCDNNDIPTTIPATLSNTRLRRRILAAQG
jgi:hypothetical protein